ncbi:CBASS cGAMP-activated phospholipase [Bradyrhizobium sp. SYSU BS000235]|uniref:CBASS cGAMP-activated phospholipase n=1 Tax=Bradyrhizobium sp. SYSU BS000235 TaxID=3411332 RepID=UPI003C718653
MNYIPPRRSDGTIQHARLKQPWPQGRPFRILSIDGGGIRGVFPAAVLAELENRFLGGASITNHFDMIAGTSTGGIIALAHGMTARQALNIYLDRGERIFPPAAGLGKVSRVLRWVYKPKHDQAALKEELLRIFGDNVLDDAVTRLVIPSFEGRHGEPFLYKTPHHPDYQKDRHKKFAHVALHTTAAPSYYPGVEDDGYVMIDGGIWANNPVMNALVDALACFDIAREDVRILSLGTGESTFTVDERARNGGIKDWAFLRSFNAASRAQSRNALGQAYLLVGKNNVTRIDVPESDEPIAMDDVQRSVRELPMVARSLVEGAGHHIERMFLDGAVTKFIHCR